MPTTYKELKTKLLLRQHPYSYWTYEGATPPASKVAGAGEYGYYVPFYGEVCICEVPNNSGAPTTTLPPTVLFKVGNGADYFMDLNWASALAADVYAWAKESSLAVTTSGSGNAVSAIEWDPTANSGKGALKVTLTNVSFTDTNQKIKGNGTGFGDDDVIDIVGGGATTVTADTTNKKITISTPSVTDTNQKVKAGSVTFGNDDVVNFEGSGIVTVTGDASNDKITISASHQSIKTLDTTATTAQSTNASEAIAGSGTVTLHKVSKTGTYSDLIGKPTLGTAAAKDYTTSVVDGGSNLPTAGAVSDAIDAAIAAIPAPMVFKGTLGTGGTITTLPTASASNEGYTYKVITAGTYAGQTAKVGDVFVSNGSAWVLIPAGDDVEDTWRNIKVNGTELLGTGISSGAVNFKSGSNVTVSGSGNDITIAASQPTVNDGNMTIEVGGHIETTFSANTADNIDINLVGSGATSVSAQTSDGNTTITISSTDTTYTSGSASGDDVPVTVNSTNHTISAALSSTVQTSLGKADSALQSISANDTAQKASGIIVSAKANNTQTVEIDDTVVFILNGNYS